MTVTYERGSGGTADHLEVVAQLDLFDADVAIAVARHAP